MDHLSLHQNVKKVALQILVCRTLKINAMVLIKKKYTTILDMTSK